MTDSEREKLREDVQAVQERWLAVCTAYERGEVDRREARAATLEYDMAQAVLSGDPDVIRAVDIERAKLTSESVAEA